MHCLLIRGGLGSCMLFKVFVDIAASGHCLKSAIDLLLRSHSCFLTVLTNFWSLNGITPQWIAFLLVGNWAGSHWDLKTSLKWQSEMVELVRLSRYLRFLNSALPSLSWSPLLGLEIPMYQLPANENAIHQIVHVVLLKDQKWVVRK